MKECIGMAKALNIPVINMHLLKGVYVTLPGKVILLSDVYLEKYLDNVRSFISMCEEEIGKSDLMICIENVDSNPFTSSQVRALELFMSSPVFALTLDVGHMECLSGKDSYIFEKYADKLYHMHLHDSDGKSCHLALGDGRVDILSKIEKLKGNTCLVEVKTLDGLGASTKYLQKHGLMKAD
jgi:sugar phosphate isomerase/epimerase